MKKWQKLFLILECVYLSIECARELKRLLKRKKKKEKDDEEEKPKKN